MKNLIAEFVGSLSDEVKKRIIVDFNQFEKDGFIGDCTLRENAEKLIKNIQGEGSIALWMDRLMFECFRFYSEQYLKPVWHNFPEIIPPLIGTHEDLDDYQVSEFYLVEDKHGKRFVARYWYSEENPRWSKWVTTVYSYDVQIVRYTKLPA